MSAATQPSPGATITRVEALRMFEEAFMEPGGSLDADSARADIPGWDSMGALMIIAEFDSRFGLELTPEESRPMKTIGELLSFLQRHGRLAD